MISMSSLAEGYRAWVFGASGGIGSALTALLEGDARCTAVHSGARSPLPADGKKHPFLFSLEDEESVRRAVDTAIVDGPPDIVIVATGRLHGHGLQPEKSMRVLDADTLMESYRINAIGPALIAKHVLPKLPRDRKSVFAALSARVSSISDNRSGGWHAYRASKAALNMLIRNCSIELAVRNPNAVCVTLHPGTVDTNMSKPFQSHVPSEKLFSPAVSALHLLRVANDLTPENTGRLIAWDGQVIDY